LLQVLHYVGADHDRLLEHISINRERISAVQIVLNPGAESICVTAMGDVAPKIDSDYLELGVHRRELAGPPASHVDDGGRPERFCEGCRHAIDVWLILPARLLIRIVNEVLRLGSLAIGDWEKVSTRGLGIGRPRDPGKLELRGKPA
jgi:hypothetical protein